MNAGRVRWTYVFVCVRRSYDAVIGNTHARQNGRANLRHLSTLVPVRRDLPVHHQATTTATKARSRRSDRLRWADRFCTRSLTLSSLQGRNGKCIPSLLWFLFLHPFFSFPFLSPASKWPLKPSWGFEGALLATVNGGTTFAATRHVPWALGSKYAKNAVGHKRIFYVFRAQGTCLVAANVVLFLLHEI